MKAVLAFALFLGLPFFAAASQRKVLFSSSWASSIRLKHKQQVTSLLATSEIDLHVPFNLTTETAEDGRTYHLFLPDSAGALDSSVENLAKRPALLMFHGAWSDAHAFATEGFMHTDALRRGYVIAYLDGTPTPLVSAPSGGRMWNSGTAGGYAGKTHVDDVSFISAVVQELIEDHNVDPTRVFASGISNGASMVLRAACERPELFAAVAPVHGSLEFREGDPCAHDCDEDGYCKWASEREGCRIDDWVGALNPVFECDRLAEKKLPLMILNGMEALGSDPAGGVYKPHTLGSESFSPLPHMFQYFRQLYGCGSRFETFANGTDDDYGTDNDWTHCSGYENCPLLKTCISSGGDWWYGDDYDVTKPCLYKGYTRCDRQAQFQDWGTRTTSIQLTQQVLDFFSKADAGVH
jgi:poly(3-hydroxybutyrate) depolymerase